MAAINILDIKNNKGLGLHLQLVAPDEDGDFRLTVQRDDTEMDFYIDQDEAEALQSFIDYHLNFKA